MSDKEYCCSDAPECAAPYCRFYGKYTKTEDHTERHFNRRYCATVGRDVRSIPVEKPQMMICPHDCGKDSCGHNEPHERDALAKFPGIAAISPCGVHYCHSTGYYYSCVPVEQPQEPPEPPALVNLDVIRSKYGARWSDGVSGEIAIILVLCEESKRLRSALSASRRTGMILEKQRDELRRTRDGKDVILRVVENERDDARQKLASAQTSLEATGIAGIYTTFGDLPDAIGQMAQNIKESASRRDEFAIGFSRIADIVGADEMWPVRGLQVAIDAARALVAERDQLADELQQARLTVLGLEVERDELRTYWSESLDISGALAEEVVSLTYDCSELRRRLEQARLMHCAGEDGGDGLVDEVTG